MSPFPIPLDAGPAVGILAKVVQALAKEVARRGVTPRARFLVKVLVNRDALVVVVLVVLIVVALARLLVKVLVKDDVREAVVDALPIVKMIVRDLVGVVVMGCAPIHVMVVVTILVVDAINKATFRIVDVL